MLQQARSAGRHVLAHLRNQAPRVLTRLQGRVLILGYHRVLPDHERQRRFVQPGMYVQPHVFEAHLRFLREYFRVLSFPEYLDLRRARAWEPRERYCLITLDDGWLDNYVYALPILRRYRAPATIFLATALIGRDTWLWPDTLGWLLTQAPQACLRPLESRYPWIARLGHSARPGQVDAAIEACKEMPEREIAGLVREVAHRSGLEPPNERLFLDWREVEEMSGAGIAFGSHSATHRILTRLSGAELRAEVGGSLETLRRNAANGVPVFCYPNGDHDEAVVDEVRAAGYQAAVSTRAGIERWDGADMFRLKRVGVHEDVSASLPLLAFHLSRVGQL
jgi:peptidoglycan/xylan/chitin deacetylase (PgdA/CDA1 family)